MQQSQAVNVVGAGVAGSWQALLFAKAGHKVTVFERGDANHAHAAGYWAGGMLAPDCEAETAEPVVTRLGRRSLDLWRAHLPDMCSNGSLVVAHPRDRADYERFARLTSGYERVDARRLGELEPALAGRFRDGLFFADEAHVEPRHVLSLLHRQLEAAGAMIRFGETVDPRDLDGTVIDCRGLAARDVFPDLRGVRGEIIVVDTPDVTLSRPVRLIHPRWPLYIVPRPKGRYLIGATTIESEDGGAVTVRSALELLTAAYTVHPAFGEARIVELGAGLRPAFPDHAPRIRVDGARIAVNGLYRHGFLLAPALAELTVNYIRHGTRDNEVMRWS
ncbi:MAG TPA: FAD-dependent oxidoreductase [Beijerinckiaceae bacterium]|jgi:glycine oxidase